MSKFGMFQLGGSGWVQNYTISFLNGDITSLSPSGLDLYISGNFTQVYGPWGYPGGPVSTGNTPSGVIFTFYPGYPVSTGGYFIGSGGGGDSILTIDPMIEYPTDEIAPEPPFGNQIVLDP